MSIQLKNTTKILIVLVKCNGNMLNRAIPYNCLYFIYHIIIVSVGNSVVRKLEKFSIYTTLGLIFRITGYGKTITPLSLHFLFLCPEKSDICSFNQRSDGMQCVHHYG